METQIFLFGFALGAVTAFSVIVLFWQWLLASGAVYLTSPELTRDEQRMVDEERLRELTEYAIEVASWQPGRWPERPRRKA